MKKKRSVHPWRPPSRASLLSSRENRLFASHVAKLAHGATFLRTPFLGNTLMNPIMGTYTEKAGDLSVLGDLNKLYITSSTHNSGCDTIVTM